MFFRRPSPVLRPLVVSLSLCSLLVQGERETYDLDNIYDEYDIKTGVPKPTVLFKVGSFEVTPRVLATVAILMFSFTIRLGRRTSTRAAQTANVHAVDKNPPPIRAGMRKGKRGGKSKVKGTVASMEPNLANRNRRKKKRGGLSESPVRRPVPSVSGEFGRGAAMRLGTGYVGGWKVGDESSMAGVALKAVEGDLGGDDAHLLEVDAFSGRMVGYDALGELKSGPNTMIWMHGECSSRAEWRLVARAALDEGMGFIAIDRPGLGDSESEPRCYPAATFNRSTPENPSSSSSQSPKEDYDDSWDELSDKDHGDDSSSSEDEDWEIPSTIEISYKAPGGKGGKGTSSSLDAKPAEGDGKEEENELVEVDRLTAVALDALAVADFFGLDKFAVGGTGVGGCYALALAALAPERVLSVATVGTPSPLGGQPSSTREKLSRAIQKWVPGAARLSGFVLEQAPSTWGRLRDELLWRGTVERSEASGRLALAVRTEGLLGSGSEGWKGAYRDAQAVQGSNSPWSRFDLTKVVCPVTVVHGEKDSIVQVSDADALASALPRGTKCMIEGGGHYLLYNPDLCKKFWEVASESGKK